MAAGAAENVVVAGCKTLASAAAGAAAAYPVQHPSAGAAAVAKTLPAGYLNPSDCPS